MYRQGGFVLADIAVKKGQVEAVSEKILPRPGDRIFDFSNCILVPGFVDVHVHLREPGFVYKETIVLFRRSYGKNLSFKPGKHFNKDSCL